MLQTDCFPVDLTFAFMDSEGFVGDSAAAQITVKLDASEKAGSICLSELRIHFGSNFRNLQISHAESTNDVFSTLNELREEHDPSHPMAKSLHCTADLRLSPGQVRIYNVSIPLREADLLNATEASVLLKGKGASLEYLYSRPTDIAAQTWFLQSGDNTITRVRSQKSVITVLPKPPKMQITIPNLRECYTGENVVLQVDLANEEDENADVSLEAKMQNDEGLEVSLSWHADDDEATRSTDGSLPIGAMPASKCLTHRLAFTAPSEFSSYTLTVTAVYRLASSSDADPPVSKTLTLEVPFVSPFEANYDFAPRLHAEDYPDFFSLPEPPVDSENDNQPAQGIEQRWCLISRIASFASNAEALVIESTLVVVNKVTGNVKCAPDDGHHDSEASPMVVEAQGMVNVSHILNTRRMSLEDRRAASLDLSLAVKWRRQDTAPGTTTTLLLPIPRLTVPAAEPRVLCTKERSGDDPDIVAIHYTIENPSMHFLNLSMTMEASNDFAFSGPKFRSVSLTPMSRARLSYNILVFEKGDDEGVVEVNGQRGRWIMPMLRVTDPYFNRALRVLDAQDGVTSDERGNVGIWIEAK